MNIPRDEHAENGSPHTEESYFIEDEKYNVNSSELPQTRKVTSFKIPIETANNRITYKTENDIETNSLYIQNPAMQSSVIDNSINYENYKYDISNSSAPMDTISRNHINQTNSEVHATNLKMPQNAKYTIVNPPVDNTISYNLEKNTSWDMSYPVNTDPKYYMQVSNAKEKGREAYRTNFPISSKEMCQSTVQNATLQIPTSQVNKHQIYNQTVPINCMHNGNYTTYPNVEKTVMHATIPSTNEASLSATYHNPISPNVYNFNGKKEIGPLYGRRFHGYASPVCNSVLYPDNTPNFMNFNNPSIPYVNHGEVTPMSPQLYYLTKENQNPCFLKKGVQSLINVCNKNKKTQMPRYEYIVKGPSPYPPYSMYQDPRRFDVFKKITLQVGTCLDDVVNLCIDTLGSSLRKFNKNNEVNLHDLYPFYNPDPEYTRPERPTLKTGNNFIDNINVALDATTLDKHKNVPNSKVRIPIPQTQKTGFVVVDGVNKILDNLLNDPISYRKYDYYNDKVNGTEVK